MAKKRGRRRMPRRSASGRFMKAASNPAPRRRRRSVARRARRAAPRHNAYFNPRRRSYRRRARHNPPMFGGNKILGMDLKEVAYAGAGFIAPPLIEGAIKSFLPSALTDNEFGQVAVKAGIVAGLAYGGSKFLGREAGKYLAIGGGVYLVATLIVKYAPSLFSGFGASTMIPGQLVRPRALRGQVGLGGYGAYLGQGASAQLPDRLNAASRF